MAADNTAQGGAQGGGGGAGPADKGWIYHRQREQPTPDQNEPPLNHIKFYLDRYRIKEALQVFFEDNTLNLLRLESDFMWDLIPLICQRLRGLCQYRFRVFEGCERMLCRIAVDGNCNPKEVLISLLSELNHPEDCGSDDNVFRAMIRPLEGTLLRMAQPAPREENFKWVLNTLMRHVNSIELPSEFLGPPTMNPEEPVDKTRPSQAENPNVRRFIEVLPLMLNFIEEFNEACLKANDTSRLPQTMPLLTESQISEVLNGGEAALAGVVEDADFLSEFSTNRGLIHDASVNALMNLIYRPLTFLDLTTHCQEARLISKRCLTTLLRLRPDLFSPIYSMNFNSLKSLSQELLSGDEPGKEAIISLATCSYLCRCECQQAPLPEFELQSFPQVITREYMLYWHVPYVVALMERTEEFVNEKGLVLLQSLLHELSHNSLGHKFFELIQTSTLDHQLFKVMVFSPLWSNRRKAYDIFCYLCDLLADDCKVKFFKHVLGQPELRPCVRAACIDQYRKCLANVNRGLWSCQTRIDMIRIMDNHARSTGSQSIATTDANTTTATLTDSQQQSQVASTSLGNQATVRVLKERLAKFQQRYRNLGGQALVGFLELCIECCLPESQHTDIIDNFEMLLATLTMFRFLKLRQYEYADPDENRYLGDSKRLERELFNPVRNAIAMVVSELKAHHRDLVEANEASKEAEGEEEEQEAETEGKEKSKKKSKKKRNKEKEREREKEEKEREARDREAAAAREKEVREREARERQKEARERQAREREELRLLNGESDSEGSEVEIVQRMLARNIKGEESAPNHRAGTRHGDEVECLNWALCRLDLVESILVQTKELYG